ncbi:MAG: diguanylate cyclase [Acidobacteriota bacterium]
MRLYSRSDLVLIAGLTAAAFVVFARPVTQVLTFANDVQTSLGLNLIPGLIILTVVLVAHTQGRRHEMRVQSLAAEAEARQAHERSVELERLMAFGADLSRALDLVAIRNVLLRQLPLLAGRDDVWVVARSGAQWRTLVSAMAVNREDLDAWREKLIQQYFAGQVGPSQDGDWIGIEGQTCFPLLSGGAAEGAIGLPVAPASLSVSQRRVLAAAGSILAIAIRNSELFREVRENSLRDGLTGCINRRHGLETFSSELRRARRSKLPVAVIMLDIDHFKLINDRFGHQCGDDVLAGVGRRLREILRGSDLKCRYGGEEFLIVLPDTSLEGATRVAENIRREIAELKIIFDNSTIQVTVSLGLTIAHDDELETNQVISRADTALYRAKELGRNRVEAETGIRESGFGIRVVASA